VALLHQTVPAPHHPAGADSPLIDKAAPAKSTRLSQTLTRTPTNEVREALIMAVTSHKTAAEGSRRWGTEANGTIGKARPATVACLPMCSYPLPSHVLPRPQAAFGNRKHVQLETSRMRAQLTATRCSGATQKRADRPCDIGSAPFEHDVDEGKLRLFEPVHLQNVVLERAEHRKL
jgi:hypothetical protein